MSNLAIRAENLSKLYHIGQGTTARYATLAERIVDIAVSPFRSIQSVLRGQSSAVPTDTIWALNNVSFDVQHGDVIGIIGRNGAGKSTLLKILSRITEPTAGYARIYGRVGSLLEVGTGFHTELTGRENVYLNGAILGMSRHEITRKFDEIVDFSGVEKFIDTPVKHYSSGMQMRLAFAVAAHLEPEILVVDEVLAVGDAEFQKKCLGKMQRVSGEGRTVLFVSHNMNAVNQLCHSCIWLKQGEIAQIGSTAETIGAYLNDSTQDTSVREFPDNPRKQIQFRRVQVLNTHGDVALEIPDDEPFTIVYEIDVKEHLPPVYFGLILQNSEGVNVLFADSRDVQSDIPGRFPLGRSQVAITVPPFLAPDTYYVDVGIGLQSGVQTLDRQPMACSFHLIDLQSQRTTRRPGIVNLRLPWHAPHDAPHRESQPS